MNWISVKERLPKSREWVLISDARDGFVGMAFFMADKGGRWESEMYSLSADEITHWMPLPDPAKEEA